MRRHTFIARLGAVITWSCLTSGSIGEPRADEGSDTCRCVDDSLEIEGLPVTETVLKEKTDKQFPSIWPSSHKQGARKVWTTLFNVHAKEALPVLEGRLPPEEVLDTFFRCRGFGLVHHLDTKLVETAVAAAVHFQSSRVEVISGYRSPKFNDSLAKKGRHVAGESNHTRGAAMDFRLPTIKAVDIAIWLYVNFDGGVGNYVTDNFVHIDTGAKRRWRGR